MDRAAVLDFRVVRETETHVNQPRHYNPLLITVLPKERRSRHPYQLAAMACLFSLGAWQLVIGPTAVSSVNVLDPAALAILNCVCILAGLAGLAAAVIPEHIVHIRIKIWRWILRTEFDATYFRLWEEFGCHCMLASVWAAYGQATWANYGLVKGYSLGLAAAIFFGAAAIGRAVQIILTMWRAGTFSSAPTAIVASGTLEGLDGEQ